MTRVQDVAKFGGLAVLMLGFIAITRLKPRYLSSPALYIFRAFFPSWKFFDSFGDVPVLSIRWCTTASLLDSTTWTECRLEQCRKAQHLLVNTAGNDLLAKRSLLQELLRDIADSHDAAGGTVLPIEQRAVYKLVRRLAESEVASRIDASSQASPAKYQFKLSTRPADMPEAPVEDCLLSPRLEIQP